MKANRVVGRYRLTCALVLALGAVLSAAAATAQDAPAAAPAAAEKPKPFKEEELDALLAPIALHPDTLLAQILMASTYPLEIVEANRWVQQNKKLEGQALLDAAKQRGWDESVVALTAIPDVLAMMDEKLDWTQKLGDAVLAQREDVMASVQKLRGKAKEQGNLESNEHQTVTVESAPPAEAAAPAAAAAPATQTIVIQPANPEVIYVPTYSTTVVYGSWWYPSYPPYYYYPPGYAVGSAFAWGVGVGIGIGVWGDVWDDDCDWDGGDINIDNDINIDRGDRPDRGDRGDTRPGSGSKDRASAGTREAGKSFKHDPAHRKGVSYRDNATAKQYGRGDSAGAKSRESYRGRTNTGSAAGATQRPAPSTGRGGSGASTGAASSRAGSSSRAEPTTRGGSSSRTGSTSRSGSSYGGSGSSAFGGSSSGRSSSAYSSRGSRSRGGGGGGGGRGGGGRR